MGSTWGLNGYKGKQNYLLLEQLSYVRETRRKYLNLDWKKLMRDIGNNYKIRKVVNEMGTELLLIEFYSMLKI